MTGTKRKALTTDELMRSLEVSHQKRTRFFKSESSIPNDRERFGPTEEDSPTLDSSHFESEESSASEREGEDPSADEGLDSEYVSRLELPGHRDISRNKSSANHSDSYSSKTSESVSFSSLGISPPLQAALKNLSIRTPTEIQVACIPPLLSGRDCIGNAKTGSGKTIAFALPILQRLAVDPFGIFALVLTPTRELAFQISEQFAVLGSSLNIRTAVIVGGMDMMTQALELGNRPHVVVATPGRIVDHLRNGSGEWNLSRVRFLVLDEADRLLTLTFSQELSYLFDILPKERQTCLFTATLTPSIDILANSTPRPGKEKPFIHRMKESTETVETLKQHYILVPSHVREPYLFYLLCNPPESTIHLRRSPPDHSKKSRAQQKGKQRDSIAGGGEELEQPPPTIIFCTRPRTAEYLMILLKTLSIRSTSLHSRLTQRERLSSLSLFRSFVVPVLISTDVGARGLDIEDVAMVINWDMPNEAEEYIHRVGRTARGGRGGLAISFMTEKDEKRVLNIEERIKKPLLEMTLPEAKVLEKLNAVSSAKRIANMELHDTDFGKREEINRKKREAVARNG